MRFDQPLIEGILVRRREQFLATVQLRGGEQVTAHCAGAGALSGCAEPGSKVLLSAFDDPRRRFKHHVEIIYAGRTPVAVHAGRRSAIVAEAIGQGKVRELTGYATLHRDAVARRNDSIDMMLAGNGLRPCYVSVRHVTLAAQGISYYPELIVNRRTRDMQVLIDLVREGCRAVIFLVVPRADTESFRPADHIDPDFSLAFRDSVDRGVEALCYRAKVTRRAIELHKKMAVDLSLHS